LLAIRFAISGGSAHYIENRLYIAVYRPYTEILTSGNP
jgi:hypothetical protein